MPFLSLRTVAVALFSALLTALVLGSLVLFFRRDDNSPIQIFLPTPTAENATAGAQSGQSITDEEIRVYISGAVQVPGVYALTSGDRLEDAIAAAGGASAEAELSAVNLARRVQDEQHYHIPVVGETPPAWPSAQVEGTGATQSEDDGVIGGLVNLNTASAVQLATLPGIGEALADAIITYREDYGPFKSVEEITNVPRIGPATYEKLRDMATVGDNR